MTELQKNWGIENFFMPNKTIEDPAMYYWESYDNRIYNPEIDSSDSTATTTSPLATLLTTLSNIDNETDEIFSEKLKKIEHGYSIFCEKSSSVLNKWLKIRKMIITDLNKTEQKFCLIHRATTGLTFLSSAVELVARAGLVLNDLFELKFDTKSLMMIVPVLGSIGITSSLLALSYSKSTIQDIIKAIRKDKSLVDELEIIYRKSNWIDDALQEYFPKINFNLLKDVKTDGTYEKSWRSRIYSAIILTSMKNNRKILEDEQFLSEVKTFVKSNVAQLWIIRMKFRHMLKEMSSKREKPSKEELTTGGKVFLNLSAMNLCPVFLPLFVDPGSMDKIRLICSSMTATVTAISLGEKSGEEFQELRKSCLELSEEYKRIRKLSQDILNDYD